jgi:uncharacterized protein YigA (DUF484 family)
VGQLIQFEERAVARLRERLGAAEEANQDLIAFARGHSGAVASIHAAALAAVEATTVESLLHIVACDWPAILGIDSAAIALVVGGSGLRADVNGIAEVDAAFVERHRFAVPSVEVRTVRSGHPLFGPSKSRHIRAEALIPIGSQGPFPFGLLVLGQRAELQLESRHGSELLLFLGQILAAVLRRAVPES